MAERTPLIRTALLAFLLLVGVGIHAQEGKPQEAQAQPKVKTDARPPQRESGRVFKVEFADVDQVAELLKTFCYVKADSKLRVIAARGTEEELAAVETALQKLDMPPVLGRDVEVTGYIVAASPKPGLKDGIPKEIESAVAQLGQVLSFKSFALVDSIVIRTREGGTGQTEGTLKLDGAKGGDYKLVLDAVRIVSKPDLPSIIRIDGIKFWATAPVFWETVEGGDKKSYKILSRAKIETDVSMKEGQKVIVGKTSMEGVEGSLVLILTAKVLE